MSLTWSSVLHEGTELYGGTREGGVISQRPSSSTLSDPSSLLVASSNVTGCFSVTLELGTWEIKCAMSSFHGRSWRIGSHSTSPTVTAVHATVSQGYGRVHNDCEPTAVIRTFANLLCVWRDGLYSVVRTFVLWGPEITSVHLLTTSPLRPQVTDSFVQTTYATVHPIEGEDIIENRVRWGFA
jgi:hypothetical protein